MLFPPSFIGVQKLCAAIVHAKTTLNFMQLLTARLNPIVIFIFTRFRGTYTYNFSRLNRVGIPLIYLAVNIEASLF